ncbi:MAG: DUF378 domain-containing protein [Planctomycetota bacterium]
MNNMTWKSIDVIAYTLLIIGAINWGWVGFFGFDPVALLFGNLTSLSKLIYSLIFLAAVYDVLSMPSIFRRWDIHLNDHPART